MKISACIVICNEEKLLPRCLKSIRNVVDEIIVVHDGPCQDKSIKIARNYKARVFTRTFISEAEYHRPFCFERARGDWILQLDADEFLSDNAREKVPELIKSKKYDGYSFLWPYPDKTGYIKRGPFARTQKPALFRKEKMFMIGISHEYPRTYGKFLKRRDILLEHKPIYDNFTFEIFRTKWNKWAKLHAQQIKNINSAPAFNVSGEKALSLYSHYIFVKSHPVLSGIGETIKFAVIYLTRGIFFSGIRSWQIALMEILYLWKVRINLIKLKHGQRI